MFLSARKAAALVLLLAAAIARPASADGAAADDKAARALELKHRADLAMNALEYKDALALYDQAYALAADPALLYNKGRALQALGEYPEALDQLEHFVAAATPALKERVRRVDELVAELRGRIATVTIACDIAGAEVRIRDQSVGWLPLTKTLRINAGQANVEITADGYYPFVRSYDLPGGGLTTIEARLAPKTSRGLLVIKSSVAGAAVSIDGEARGVAPLDVSVTSGTHRVRVVHDRYRTWETSAVVLAGQQREISAQLEADGGGSILQKWWFWAGTGLVVAAGVTITAALLTEKSIAPGTISPGKVRSPLTLSF